MYDPDSCPVPTLLALAFQAAFGWSAYTFDCRAAVRCVGRCGGPCRHEWSRIGSRPLAPRTPSHPPTPRRFHTVPGEPGRGVGFCRVAC
jgi:hypothetical protein